jgi:hypothetical protein
MFKDQRLNLKCSNKVRRTTKLLAPLSQSLDGTKGKARDKGSFNTLKAQCWET